jgi:hypothetical protein
MGWKKIILHEPCQSLILIGKKYFFHGLKYYFTTNPSMSLAQPCLSILQQIQV